jgi:hypothetical protein
MRKVELRIKRDQLVVRFRPAAARESEEIQRQRSVEQPWVVLFRGRPLRRYGALDRKQAIKKYKNARILSKINGALE